MIQMIDDQPTTDEQLTLLSELRLKIDEIFTKLLKGEPFKISPEEFDKLLTELAACKDKSCYGSHASAKFANYLVVSLVSNPRDPTPILKVVDFSDDLFKAVCKARKIKECTSTTTMVMDNKDYIALKYRHEFDEMPTSHTNQMGW